jgi:hypothetical protein
MARLFHDLIWVFRCDLQSSANDLRLTLLPALVAMLVLVLGGGALLLAFEDEFVRGYAFVHGEDDDEARATIELRYYRALVGLGALAVCLVVNRYYFSVLSLLALLVTISVMSDYSSSIQVQYSESRFEEYLQRYGVEVWAVSVVMRLSFLGLLLWAAKDVRAYHLSRPRW